MAGVPDLQLSSFEENEECNPAVAVAGSPAGAPRILLAHQPRVAKLAQGLDIRLTNIAGNVIDGILA